MMTDTTDMVEFAYMSFDGCSEVDAADMEAYLASVETEVIPSIDETLQAKEEGAHLACAFLLF